MPESFFIKTHFSIKIKQYLDFPGGAVVKNLPAGAGFEPWSGKLPYATEQLSLRATATEPVL